MSSPPASAAVGAPSGTEQGVLAGLRTSSTQTHCAGAGVEARTVQWSAHSTGPGRQRANQNPGLRRPPHPQGLSSPQRQAHDLLC